MKVYFKAILIIVLLTPTETKSACSDSNYHHSYDDDCCHQREPIHKEHPPKTIVHQCVENYKPQDQERFLYLFSVDNQSNLNIKCFFNLELLLERAAIGGYKHTFFNMPEGIEFSYPTTHIYLKENLELNLGTNYLFQEEPSKEIFNTHLLNQVINNFTFFQSPTRLPKKQEHPSNSLKVNGIQTNFGLTKYHSIQVKIRNLDIVYKVNNIATKLGRQYTIGSDVNNFFKANFLDRSIRIEPIKNKTENIQLGIEIYKYPKIIPKINRSKEFKKIRDMYILRSFAEKKENTEFQEFPKDVLSLILLNYCSLLIRNEVESSAKFVYKTYHERTMDQRYGGDTMG